MSTPLQAQLRSSWREMPRFDRAVVLLAAASGLLYLIGTLGWAQIRYGFFGFLFLFLVILWGLRWVGRNRARLLWSLRNRLVVAYLLIAVVPVLLLLIMAGLSAYLIYSQYSAHLFSTGLEQEIERLATVADTLAATPGAGLVRAGDSPETLGRLAPWLAKHAGESAGLRVRINPEHRLVAGAGGRFAGIVQHGATLHVEAQAETAGPAPLVVSVSRPVTPEFLSGLAADLGPIQMTITRPARESDPGAAVLEFNGRAFLSVGQIVAAERSLPAPRHWLDYEIKGFTTVDAVVADVAEARDTSPVFIAFSSRPSMLNRRLFGSLGGFGDAASFLLVLVGFIFLMIETVALVTGIRLTRSITRTVEDLYAATQNVRTGDFSHRVRIQTRDQLGVLAESFNEMTGSISSLVERQRQTQRLEDEVAIAREVQSQLFPQKLPALPGVELAAVCRAARMVSGDYFDFVQLGPTQLALAIADISGKGISAALLMASVQAALRSQLLTDGAGPLDTAQLTARLNLHLFRNTSDDRYATLFFALYDTATRTLRYTNAGHVPPLCVMGDHAEVLDKGGTVVGLFDDCPYEQGVLQVPPDSLLVAYSDGLIEPEDAYGEEFGAARLRGEVLRHRQATPQRLAEALLGAAEEWSASPEQSDDMTVLVVRMR